MNHSSVALNLPRIILALALPLLALSSTACCKSGIDRETDGAQGNSYAAGDRVQVTWKGKLYPAVILSTQGDGRYKVHYEGYGNEWDELVTGDRIKGRAGGPTAGARQPQAQAQQGAAPGAMASDGLPVEIPEPGSKPPSVAEWNAVPREIRVKDSSTLGCETKMLREWLRVNCKPKPENLPPSNVKTLSSDGQQAYVGVYGDTTSAVIQVVRGKNYRGLFTWGGGQIYVASNLVVSWPSSAARPSIYFEDAKR